MRGTDQLRDSNVVSIRAGSGVLYMEYLMLQQSKRCCLFLPGYPLI